MFTSQQVVFFSGLLAAVLATSCGGTLAKAAESNSKETAPKKEERNISVGGVAGIWVPFSGGLYADWRHNDLVSTHVRYVSSAVLFGDTWNTLGLGARVHPFQGSLFLYGGGIHQVQKFPSHSPVNGNLSYLGGEASVGNKWNLGKWRLSAEWLGVTQEFFRLSSVLEVNKGWKTRRSNTTPDAPSDATEGPSVSVQEEEKARFLKPRTGGYLFRLSLGYSF